MDYLKNLTKGFAQSLQELGIKTFPTETYFFLARVPQISADAFSEALNKKNIHIRPLHQEGLGDDLVRFATSTSENNGIVLDAVREILNDTSEVTNDKIGFTLSRDNLDSPLSPHFGKAKWLLIYENEQTFKFIRNEKLSGQAVVETFARMKCTDAVFANIGWGALGNLKAGGIRPWYGPPGVSVRELIVKLKQNELERAVEATEKGRHEHHHD